MTITSTALCPNIFTTSVSFDDVFFINWFDMEGKLGAGAVAVGSMLYFWPQEHCLATAGTVGVAEGLEQ